MRYVEIAEEPRLPLRKGALRDVRNMAGLIAVMHPDVFLRLAATDYDYKQILHRDEFAASVADFKNGGGKYRSTTYNMPYLEVDYPSGKVTAHDGRHRAAMVFREGGSKFPVAIVFRAPFHYTVRYDRDGETHERRFATSLDAGEFAFRLNHGEDTVANVTIKRGGAEFLPQKPLSTGGSTPWQPSDMPPTLRGQFENLTVPTASMRIGVVR